MAMRAWRRLAQFVALALFTALALPTPATAESILHRGNGAEPETLDVHKSSGVPEADIQRDLFEGLVAEAADGSFIPGAAASWTISDDGRTYTFKLRPDGRWSNGDAVTAGDFVYAFRRGVDPQVGSDYAFILWPITNAEKITKGKGANLESMGVRAVDDLTLEVTLRAPTPYFLGLLTHHQAYPVHRASLAAHGSKWTRPGNLVSNGAYRLADWVPQSHVTLVRNERFRAAASVAIDKIVYYPTEDGATELKRFRAGELDVTHDVPSDQVQWIEKNLAADFHNTPYLGTYYYSLNTKSGPFAGNVKLRHALALAIDREILTGKVTRAGEVPAYSWVPPGVSGYAQQRPAWSKIDQKSRNARARKFYFEAGYSKKKPLEVEILYNTSDNHKKIAVAVSAMWKKTLGVRTTLMNQEWKVYLTSRRALQFEICRAGWIGDYNDANTFLELLKGNVGPLNPAGYANPRYDALMAKAETATDMARRAELMQEAERLMLADMPIVPIYHYTTQHLITAAVRGWQDNIMDVHPSRWLSLKR
ncbi:MAG: peptide ABC transporter substrate-binding protein [Alphaproteobacteria bacterium]|nr:peptide ABC transporter substrate-binding protein [Alphaproteobacteria bacterium]HJP22366.1 peptide ABC transporter substrate-binding protein [Alphaproteobacteria bacterium]